MVVYFHLALPAAPLFHQKTKLKLPEGASVQDALAAYARRYQIARIRTDRLSVVVNGARGGLGQTLRDRDRVKIFHPVTIG